MEFGYGPTPPPLASAVKAVWFARGTKAEFAVAGAVLRTPMWELQDRLISASSVWSGADRLLTELRELRHNRRIAHLTRVLTPRCGSVDPSSLRLVEGALAHIADRRGMVAIEQLARDAGVTRRHLERRFREQVGLRAKHVARIVRVQSVLGLIR
jgi:transcriptional regulator GlxA family with amidase domain